VAHDVCVGWLGWDWGSVPDWAEAAGTIGGLGYLAVQYHKAQKRDRDLKEQELRRTQDAEAAQARLVAMNNVR
jgi:hypothetical protein